MTAAAAITEISAPLSRMYIFHMLVGKWLRNLFIFSFALEDSLPIVQYLSKNVFCIGTGFWLVWPEFTNKINSPQTSMAFVEFQTTFAETLSNWTQADSPTGHTKGCLRQQVLIFSAPWHTLRETPLLIFTLCQNSYFLWEHLYP